MDTALAPGLCTRSLGHSFPRTQSLMQAKIEVKTDSSAAKGIAARKGLGQVRHVEVCQLWLQEMAAKGKIGITKVKGDRNHADILTQHIDNNTLDRQVPFTQQRFRAKRDKSILNIIRAFTTVEKRGKRGFDV